MHTNRTARRLAGCRLLADDRDRMGEQDSGYLQRLADEDARARLDRLGLAWTSADQSAAAALRFILDTRSKAAPNGQATMLVALVGGASSGKSTLFNSLISREVSRVSAHAHETLGPIAAAHADHLPQLHRWMDEGSLLVGFEPCRLDDQQAHVGAVGKVALCEHRLDELKNVLLIDLPDVTSQMSADEGAVARRLMPWFDGLIVVVDEERWFDAAIFDETLTFARDLGPSSWVVFNRTEHDDAFSDEQRERLADHARQQRADAFCISRFQRGSGFRPVATETREEVVRWLTACDGKGRSDSLGKTLQRRCANLLAENVARSQALDALRRNIGQEIDTLADETRLSIDLLTTDERRLLGVGHRFIPLYDVARNVFDRVSRFGRPRRATVGQPEGVDFDKDMDDLAGVLTRNLESRFERSTHAVDRVIADAGYLACDSQWCARWDSPEFDARDWAVRIRGHIDAWKEESAKTSRRGNVGALAIGTPLLLADLLFLGGAGMTLTWLTASVAGFLGGKSLVNLFDRSQAFAEYRTTVAAYQQLVRESLRDQCERNLADMPARHLAMNDPIMEAVLACSKPR